jgi:hypothetical protein
VLQISGKYRQLVENKRLFLPIAGALRHITIFIDPTAKVPDKENRRPFAQPNYPFTK